MKLGDSVICPRTDGGTRIARITRIEPPCLGVVNAYVSWEESMPFNSNTSAEGENPCTRMVQVTKGKMIPISQLQLLAKKLFVIKGCGPCALEIRIVRASSEEEVHERFIPKKSDRDDDIFYSYTVTELLTEGPVEEVFSESYIE